MNNITLKSDYLTIEQKEELFFLYTLLDENKCIDITILNLQDHHSYLRFFIIATLLSSTHLKKVANLLVQECKKHNIEKHENADLNFDSGWVILDYGAYITHLFSSEKREFYELEKTWSNATKIL